MSAALSTMCRLLTKDRHSVRCRPSAGCRPSTESRHLELCRPLTKDHPTLRCRPLGYVPDQIGNSPPSGATHRLGGTWLSAALSTMCRPIDQAVPQPGAARLLDADPRPCAAPWIETSPSQMTSISQVIPYAGCRPNDMQMPPLSQVPPLPRPDIAPQRDAASCAGCPGGLSSVLPGQAFLRLDVALKYICWHFQK